MTDISHYTDEPTTAPAIVDTAASSVGTLKAKIRAFLAKEENRKELRRLTVTFSIQYALVAVFVVAALQFVSANLNFQ